MQAPSVAKEAMNAALRVELEQVPAGQGSRATCESCERRIRGGNRGGTLEAARAGDARRRCRRGQHRRCIDALRRRRRALTTRWSCLAQAAIELLSIFFLPAGFLGRGGGERPLVLHYARASSCP